MHSHEPKASSENIWKGFTRDKGVRHFALMMLCGGLLALLFFASARPKLMPAKTKDDPCAASPEVLILLRKNGNCTLSPFKDVPNK